MPGIVSLLYQRQIEYRTTSGQLEVMTEVTMIVVATTRGTMTDRGMLIRKTGSKTVPAVVADKAAGVVEMVEEDQEEAVRMVGSPHRTTLSWKSKTKNQPQIHHN